MFTKVSETIQGVFAVFAFIAIVGVSALTVVSLNPKVYKQSEASQVAGIDESKIVFPLQIINNSIDDYKYRTELTAKSANVYEYKISYTDQFPKGKNVRNFIKIINNNDTNARVKFRSYVTKDTERYISINLLKDLDVVNIFSKDRKTSEDLTVKNNSETPVMIELDALESVNFPFEIVIEISF